MGLRINQNIAALNAARNLRKTDSAMSQSLERLSSGFRVNRAADDPAGLIISENLRAQIAGLGQAIKNSQNAVNLVSTAEAALDEVLNQLRSIRTLALDALNTGASDIVAIAADQTQIASSISTLTRIGNNTQFGKIKLLDGSAGVSGSTKGTDFSFVAATSDAKTGTYSITTTKAATKGFETFNLNNESELEASNNASLGVNQVSAFKVQFGSSALSAAELTQLGKDLTAAGVKSEVKNGITIEFDEATASVSITIAEDGGAAASYGGPVTAAVFTDYDTTGLSGVIALDNSGGKYKLAGKVSGLGFEVQDLTYDGVSDGGEAGFNAADVTGTGTNGTFRVDATNEDIEFTIDFGAQFTGNANETAERAAFGAFLVKAGLATGAAVTNTNAVAQVITVTASTAKVVVKLSAVNAGAALADMATSINNTTIGRFMDFAGGTDDFDVTSRIGGITFTDGTSNNSGASGIGGGSTAGATTLNAAEVGNLGSSTAFNDNDIFLLQESLTFNATNVVNIVSGTTVKNVANQINTGLLAAGVKVTAGIVVDVAGGTDNVLTFTNDVFGTQLAANGLNTVTSDKGDATPNTFRLGFNLTARSITGEDVIGKINGIDATAGSGQILKLNSSGDDANGVSVKYIGSTDAVSSGASVTVAASGLQFQVGANSGQTVSQGLPDVRANRLGLTATGLKTSATSLNDIDVKTSAGAGDALVLVDAAIAEITTIRGELGAFQTNVLESTISSLGAARENLASAESSIRDADFADETVQFTRNQILLQAGTAILTQANAIPQAVLQLLA